MIYIYIYIYIYLTAIGLTPGGSSTSHIYTQTVHIIQRKENGKCGPCHRLSELYPGICLTTEEKAWKTSARVEKYKNNEQYNAQKKNSNTEYTKDKTVYYM
jgi:hypothetical protein